MTTLRICYRFSSMSSIFELLLISKPLSNFHYFVTGKQWCHDHHTVNFHLEMTNAKHLLFRLLIINKIFQKS